MGQTTFPVPVVSTGAIQQQTFTATGTFTVPTGVTTLEVLTVGGGGGGNNNTYGGGGDGGKVYSELLTGLTPGASITVTIGAGGATGTPGATGSTSSFGAYRSATGGTGSSINGNSMRGGAGAASGGQTMEWTAYTGGGTGGAAGFAMGRWVGGGGYSYSNYGSGLPATMWSNGAANTGAGGGSQGTGGSGIVVVRWVA